MRKLLFLLLLAGVGYYFYTQRFHDALPSESVWREVVRDQRGTITQLQVIAVSGDRWRLEAAAPGKARVLVLVSDGTSAASSIPQAPAASLDPRPVMRLILKTIRRARPEATERIAGRDYLRFTQTRDGITVHVWADPQTRFPFRVRGFTTPFTDVTYTALPESVIRDTPDLFSTTSLAPLLSRYLGSQ